METTLCRSNDDHIHKIIMDGFSPFQFIRKTDISPFEIKKRGYSPLRYRKLKPPKGYPPIERLGILKDIIAGAIDPEPSKRPALDQLYASVVMWKSAVENL
jgi:hypothetical protein